MLIGSVLTYRLKQISKKIQHTATCRVNDVIVWKTIRKDYTRISQLCYIVNERLSGVIITCFLLDLYFILLQLYKSLKPIESIVEKVYFYISFALLLTRIFCICICGGEVFEEWKNIRFYLNTVATSAYNLEIERLTYHVATWELSLSGKNFFAISRGLILQMAGAIVAYELVLIQFFPNSS
ncbi:gustatory receptor for sugar taste 64a-like [Diorhabda carinulata]|uniref:gustatory receptor for sugar taste 64a-like n=1 Tax=Diorhabda carinulata TaxID=1163345 RepID=UPI0025A2DBC0|nr:gustatory receptor for sugar taste 64a-like [Diorhabda carinulata]